MFSQFLPVGVNWLIKSLATGHALRTKTCRNGKQPQAAIQAKILEVISTLGEPLLSGSLAFQESFSIFKHSTIFLIPDYIKLGANREKETGY